MEIVDSFCIFLKKYRLNTLNKRLVLAISGGSDSMCLLFLMHEACKISIIDSSNVFVISIDHGVREESSSESSSVKKMAQDMGFNAEIFTISDLNKNSNFQKEARDKRYKILFNFCNDIKSKYILLAHHMDDVAENVIMSMCRGSGIDGMANIASISLWGNGISLIRPLLNFSKIQLQNYLQKLSIDWFEDPSNQDSNYYRVFYRKLLSSSDDAELLKKRIFSFYNHMLRAKEAMNFYLEKEWKKFSFVSKYGYIQLDLQNILQLPEDMFYRILLKAIHIITPGSYKPRYEAFSNICNEIINRYSSGDQQKIFNISGVEFVLSKNKLFILRELRSIPTIDIENENEKILWDERYIITLQSQDFKKHNLFIGPLGINGLHDIKDSIIHNVDITGLEDKFVLNKLLPTLPTLKNSDQTILSSPLLLYEEGYALIEAIFKHD